MQTVDCKLMDFIHFIFIFNTNTAAASSTTFSNYVASRAVDGNFDQNHTSCSHTGVNTSIKEAWIRVDLGRVYSLKSVKFWYSGDSK